MNPRMTNPSYQQRTNYVNKTITIAPPLILPTKYITETPSNYSYQTNHYSTAAYLYYYLMRVNPFTNMMIKFQSGNFDLPDRQYFDIKETINLCQYLSNNRELLPELYSLPEAYLNLNDNDFGKQKQGVLFSHMPMILFNFVILSRI